MNEGIKTQPLPIEKKKSLVTIRKSNVWSTSSSFSESPSPSSYPSFFESNERDLMSFSSYLDEKDKNVFQEEEKLPKSIDGEYIYDYNILNIDNIIKKKFKQDKKNKLSLLRNKLELEKQKIQERQSMIERKTSRKKIAKYEEEIKKYEKNVEKREYLKKSGPLINAYNQLNPISNIVSFVNNNKETKFIPPENEEQQSIRHKIIFDYLECARKYISINLIRKIPNSSSCSGCGTKYDEMDLIDDDSGYTVCSVCNLEKISVYRNPFFSDGCRVNNSRNNYEDRANFEKVLMRYQGKQMTKPDKVLYKKLDEYFIGKGLPSSEEYRKMPLLPNGKKEGTSRELMFEALSKINCSGYYDDINLICNVFFGWTLPDVSHLEEDIMSDYDISQRVYEQLPDREGRKSSLNSQWRLYKLLKRRGWPCKARDFKIPMTQDILEYHKMKWKEICKILDWDDL